MTEDFVLGYRVLLYILYRTKTYTHPPPPPRNFYFPPAYETLLFTPNTTNLPLFYIFTFIVPLTLRYLLISGPLCLSLFFTWYFFSSLPLIRIFPRKEHGLISCRRDSQCTEHSFLAEFCLYVREVLFI